MRFERGFLFLLEFGLYGDRMYTRPRRGPCFHMGTVSVAPPPRFIVMFTSSEEREADCYWPFSHMSPPLGPSLHDMYGTSKVVLPILKARQKPHPDLRSGPPSEDS